MNEPPTAHVSVQSRKYDGRLQRSWPARLAVQTGSLLVLDATFTEEIRHPWLGTIVPGTRSTEYYWTDRWYSIFRFAEPHGALRNFYCNINQPATFDGQTLTFVDLDIDLLIWPDFAYRILDEDEFATNSVKFKYPAELQRQARAALAAVLALLEGRHFPFT